MYLRRDQADKLLETTNKSVFDQLQKHVSFVTELLSGDDWSFVIKAQALIEACVTQAIVIRLGENRIIKMIEVMPLVGDEVSKLKIAKDLNILNSAQRKFVIHMATLRNRLAHRVDCVNFKFSEHIETLNKDGYRNWKESIVWFCNEQTEKQQWQEISIKNPRASVLMGVFMIAALLTIDDSEVNLKRAIDQAVSETTEELLKSLM